MSEDHRERAAPLLNPDGSWGMAAEQFGDLLREMRRMQGSTGERAATDDPDEGDA